MLNNNQEQEFKSVVALGAPESKYSKEELVKLALF
jgi:hypothetical protein